MEDKIKYRIIDDSYEIFEKHIINDNINNTIDKKLFNILIKSTYFLLLDKYNTFIKKLLNSIHLYSVLKKING